MGQLFDEDGNIPECNCKMCGNPLRDVSSGYPERHIGVYTGLCYPCARKEAFIVETTFIGANLWSYPRQMGDNRLERHEYRGFADCEDCNGSGRIYHSRSFGQGGSYSSQCSTCSTRHWSHPVYETYRATREKADNWSIAQCHRMGVDAGLPMLPLYHTKGGNKRKPKPGEAPVGPYFSRTLTPEEQAIARDIAVFVTAERDEAYTEAEVAMNTAINEILAERRIPA